MFVVLAFGVLQGSLHLFHLTGHNAFAKLPAGNRAAHMHGYICMQFASACTPVSAMSSLPCCRLFHCICMCKLLTFARDFLESRMSGWFPIHCAPWLHSPPCRQIFDILLKVHCLLVQELHRDGFEPLHHNSAILY